MRLCASWAEEHRPSTFVILINFSNLAVIKKVTAKPAIGTQNTQPSQSLERWLQFLTTLCIEYFPCCSRSYVVTKVKLR